MFGRCLRKKRKQSDEEPISLIVGKNQFPNITFHDKKISAFPQFNIRKILSFVVQNVYGINSLYQLCLKNPLQDFKPQFKEEEGFSDFYKMEEKQILVLDLDETLIHSDIRKTNALDKEVIVPVGDSLERYYVKKRPYLEHFLKKMSQIFELVVYTASLQSYADQVIDYIDPERLITRRYYRQVRNANGVCFIGLYQNRTFYKDLKIIDECMERIFIIDNSLAGFMLNKENGLMIRSWYCDQYDKELYEFGNFLSKNFGNNKEDVREVIKQLKGDYKNNILNA